MSDAPKRRRVAMPVPTEWPRAGKIRLGIKKAGTSKAGDAIEFPSALDYFRVDAADEITAPESAASFHEVYGPEPRSIRCQLPGRTPDDVFEGAWKLYGARKLKIRCDGTECDERTGTGGWETKPCVCKAQGIPPVKANGNRNEKHCSLNWTFSVLLPDVVGVGVWQIDTSSEISIARISRWLQMMASVSGDLMLLDFTLNLVPVDVNPDGRTKRVYVLEPRAVGATPRELLTGGGRAPLPQLDPGAERPAIPPPADEEEPPAEEGIVVQTWEEALQDLRDLAPGLDDKAIGSALASCFGRTVNATELSDPAISGRAINYFLELRERAQAALASEEQSVAAGASASPGPGRREPDDPPPADGPEGDPNQGTLATEEVPF